MSKGTPSTVEPAASRLVAERPLPARTLRLTTVKTEAQILDPAAILSATNALEQTVEAFLGLQNATGYWVFDLEADATIPSEYILLQRFLGRELPPGLSARVCDYLRDKQLPDGSWSLYDEDGIADLSASVKAYFALKLCGDSPDAEHMVRARQLILSMGGAAKVNVFTRITLALFGQVPWRLPPAMPVEIMLLPKWFFFHLDKVSYWSRTVIVPLLLLYAKKPVCKLKPEEYIAELFVTPPDKIVHLDGYIPGAWRKNAFILLDRLLKKYQRFIPNGAHEKAIARALTWTREHMQGTGGIGAIFPAMANAVMALKLYGAHEDDPDYVRGVKALDDLVLDRSGNTFVQPCVSPIWDTCLMLSALTEAGLAPDHERIKKGADWLWSQQVFVSGDWAGKAPEIEPGGWAFQFENALYPDLDDTAMVLMALMRAGCMDDESRLGDLAKAVNWLIGLQSSDGGFAAFDIDNNYLYLNDIPFADHGALLDPSTSDLTARCIEVLAMLGFGRDFAPIAKGLEFLRKEQEEFGGWFGRWGVNYIYGTWSVLSALGTLGEDPRSPMVRRAVDWLKSCQNEDGGWGETCYSYNDKRLAGRGATTPSQTAWALLGLLAAGETHSPEVARGVAYLLHTRNFQGGWDERHYTGTGFPRVFYLRYHGYAQFFPLWALSVYRRKIAGKPTRQQEVTRSRPLTLHLPALHRKA